MSQPLFRRRTLTESLSVSTVHNTRHKTNYLSLYFCLPLTEETASASSLLAHLITGACEKYPKMIDLRRKKAALYSADISAATSTVGDTLLFVIGASFLKDRYAPLGAEILNDTLSLVREFLRAPRLVGGTFDPALVRLEAKNAADDARAILNDKCRYSRRRHTELMYEGKPFAVSPLGRAETIEALSPAELTEAFFKLLAHAPVEAIFVGEADEDALAASLVACFDGLQSEPHRPAPSTVGTCPDAVRDITETMDLNQAHLCLGFRSPLTRTHPDFPAFTVANTVFGSGTTSKLFMNVREKLSLCYRVSSIYNANNGFLQIYAGIDAQKRDEAQAEILLQLAHTKNKNITEEELQNAKNTLRGAIKTVTDAPDTLSVWAIPRILSGLEIDPEREISLLESVTADEAAAAFSTVKADTFYCLKKEEA